MATCNYESWTVKDLSDALIDKHKDKKQIVVPMFQRGKRWKPYQEEVFIDSLEQGFPVGTMLFYRTVEGEKEVYTLVDGLQRSNTIKQFIECPTKYFKSDSITDKVIDEIYTILALNTQEKVVKNQITDIIVESIQNLSSYKNIQFYPIAKKIISEHPTQNEQAIERIIEIIDPFLTTQQEKFDNIASTVITIIVYSGEESTLPYIFDRINSKGTPLTTYEIYAASWPLNKKFKVNNESIIEKVLKKYDSLSDSGYDVSGYDRECIRKDKKLTAFEYLFGLSRFLNDKYTILNFVRNSDDDVINPMAFELINACFFDTKDTIKDLYKKILSTDINEFEAKLISVIEYVEDVIKPIHKFKGNTHNKKNIILHSKYQILSMISATFREKYEYDTNENIRKTWKANKKTLHENMMHHYVYDIIIDEWSEGGQSKLYKASRPNKYLESISYSLWETALNSYFESSNTRRESKKSSNPSKVDIVILNCIYISIFSAMDQLSVDNFDIEHIATKSQMKSKIADSHCAGLPISSIGNICYLPEKINRSKGRFNFYQDENYLKHINLGEVERKYSFTQRSDLEWLEICYNKDDCDLLQGYYSTYLKKRFEIQKQKFYESLDIPIQ